MVEASAIIGALTVTMLTESGEPEYLKWDFEDKEITRSTNPDDEVGFAAPDSTAASAFNLGDIDLEAIVERDACEQDSFTFNYRAVGLNGEHRYLYTECSEIGDSTTIEFHEYIDAEPVVDPDLSDPAALAQVAQDAREFTGQPAELASVRLGYSDTGGMHFRLAASATTGTNLEGFPCQVHYKLTTEMKAEYGGSLRTSCRNPEDSDLGKLAPYDAALFDPAVMANLWTSEIGERKSGDAFPTVTLLRDLDNNLVYAVYDEGETDFFDPKGNPLR
ncbi:MAG: hypothetical protein ACTH2Q_11505 [Propionibacteriaceae bacterium]